MQGARRLPTHRIGEASHAGCIQSTPIAHACPSAPRTRFVLSLLLLRRDDNSEPLASRAADSFVGQRLALSCPSAPLTPPFLIHSRVGIVVNYTTASQPGSCAGDSQRCLSSRRLHLKRTRRGWKIGPWPYDDMLTRIRLMPTRSGLVPHVQMSEREGTQVSSKILFAHVHIPSSAFRQMPRLQSH